MGDKLSNSSTRTKFFRALASKKKVSSSSRGIAELNSGSSSSHRKNTWKLENHFPAFFALPLLVFFSNFNFCVEKKSFCAERFEIVLNGTIYLASLDC
ncbi:hypothetical protein BpHYR1_040439 [Brachionus plicatilis]|uniref:Uncharacterized protein n=1 Tax=Brachionus plicatilis TaxID=10195 RepID=A0A3M7QXX8_BRAPC|nr:hypothetical protein BpHYR1_040439 [Brachionus plicatilis]